MILLQLGRIGRSEFDTPYADRLLTDRDAILCQQVFGITRAQIEAIVDPYCIANDAGVKTMSLVGTHQRVNLSVLGFEPTLLNL